MLWVVALLLHILVVPVLVVLLGGGSGNPEIEKMFSIRRVLRKNGLLSRRDK